MTKIDIFSGFLGAGKTTLIKKLIEEAYHGEKIVLIENEFGEIGIDGGFLAEAGIQINEMNSGCICCSLVGDFAVALKKVIDEYAPDRILIEPSGVGKLSDVIKAVENADTEGAVLNCLDYVGKLAYSGGLDENTVGSILVDYLFQSNCEISYERATDATGIHFVDLNSRLCKESTVDSDLTEFVLYENDLFSVVCFFNELFDKSGLSRSEKARKNIDLCHNISLS